MLAGDAKILKKCIKERKYDDIYELNFKLDVRNELVKIFPQIFERTVERAGPDGIVKKQTIVDPGSASLEAVLETLQANRRHLNL